MIEAINTFIGPVFMHIVIASGIAALFMMLSFVTIKLLRVHNLTLTYNAYFITLLSFLAVPVIALILTEIPIDKPHFDFMPISPPVETIESTGTITYESSEIEMVPQDKFNRRETASNEETSDAIHEKFRLGSIMKLMRKHLPVIWFSGFLLFSSLLILNLARLKAIRNRAKFLKNIDPREFGFSLTKVSLLTSNQINSPATISIWKPEIILPEGLLENSTDEETKFILCHELTHILRKDFLVNLIQNILLSFNFFNPIFWILNKRLNILRENICDNWVLSRHSDRKAYANLLLKFIEKFQQKSGIMEPSIGIFRSHSQIGSRIHRILTSSHLSTLTTPGARRIGLVLSLSLFLLAGWIYAGMQSSKDEPQQEIQGKIVFTRREGDGVLTLYTMNADGTEERKIYRHHNPVNSNILFPYWSESGEKIFFAAYEKDNWYVWSITSNGTGLKLIRKEADRETITRSIRPKSAIGILSTREGSIYLNGKELVRFRGLYSPDTGSSGFHYPSWSTDGKWIICNKYTGMAILPLFGRRKSRTWIISPDGKIKKMIASKIFHTPDWFIPSAEPTIQKVTQSKPQFRIKITRIRTKENGEQVVNSQEVVALLDTPASINIGDKDFPPYCHYEVTPSLTKKGMILLKVNYELRESKGKTTSIKTQVILKDGETKEVGIIGDKEKLTVTVERSTANNHGKKGCWKTYRNEKYGFELKYPADWGHGLTGRTGYSFTKTFVKDTSKVEWMFYIHYILTEDFDDYFKNHIKDCYRGITPHKTEMDLGGRRAVKVGKSFSNAFYGIKMESEEKFSFMLFHRTAKIISDKTGLYQKRYDDSKCEKIFNQMLSTFKFIEKKGEILCGKFEIDLNKIAKLQRFVNNKHQSWRLDPVMVARSEALLYGFVEDDLKTLHCPHIDSHWKMGIDITELPMKITHDGKTYNITVKQPIPGKDKIWVVSEIQLKQSRIKQCERELAIIEPLLRTVQLPDEQLNLDEVRLEVKSSIGGHYSKSDIKNGVWRLYIMRRYWLVLETKNFLLYPEKEEFNRAIKSECERLIKIYNKARKHMLLDGAHSENATHLTERVNNVVKMTGRQYQTARKAIIAYN